MTPHQRTRAQAICLLMAHSARLYAVRGVLVLRELRHGISRDTPVRAFSWQAIATCEKNGWIIRLNHDGETLHFVLTPAGSAEMARPLMIAKAPRTRGPRLAPHQMEALR